MSNFTVRAFEPGDHEGFGRVRSRVYRGGDPVRPDENLLKSDCFGYVVESDRQIVGTATAVDLTCSRNGELHRCAGIAAVGVLPEWRGTGAGSALMRGIHPLLREQGFKVSSLHPFSDPWYRRFGYTGMGRKLQIRCPALKMPAINGTLPVREIPTDQFAALEPVSRHMAASYNGFCIRKDEQWWRTLGGDSPLALYVAGDPVEAYAIVRLKGDFWVDQEIKEFVWSTENGYHSMFSLFRSLGFNKSTVTWFEPGDSPYYESYFDRGTTVEVTGPIMFRLLDVPDEDVMEETRKWLGPSERVYCLELF